MSTRSRIFLLVCVAAVAFFAGRWQRGAPAAHRILYYQDPMHPEYRSDKPGIAPDCGMQLEPVYADGEPPQALDRNIEPVAAGAVRITPERQQLIGMRTEEASEARAPQTIRVPGRVVVDETRVFRVSAAVDGWIRRTGPVTAGSIIRKDDLLATFYNREFLTAQQTYLYAVNTMDRFREKESAEQLKLTKAQMQAAEENLEFLGMGETQVRQIARTRHIAKDIELRSPVDGVVIARNAVPGMRFDRGSELFRVADLNHVWVLADLFGREARYVRPGQRARVFAEGSPKSVPAKVTASLPQFDAASRTLKVRLELENAGYILRPDMFVDVELPVTLPPALTISADAVIDSGLNTSVFVDRGNGLFEPRRVEVAWRFGDRAGIARGIEPGERIVVSGNFLIDSESRMRLAGARTAEQRKPGEQAAYIDPVCGMQVGATALKIESHGIAHHFCSNRCKQAFERDPARYAEKRASLPRAGDKERR